MLPAFPIMRAASPTLVATHGVPHASPLRGHLKCFTETGGHYMNVNCVHKAETSLTGPINFISFTGPTSVSTESGLVTGSNRSQHTQDSHPIAFRYAMA